MSSDYTRDKGGKFSGDVTRQDILLVFDKLGADGPLTASEVAEELPIGRRAVHHRLEQMHEDGDLGKKSFGNRVVWWAEIAPRLDPDLQEELDATRDEDWDNAVPLEDINGEQNH